VVDENLRSRLSANRSETGYAALRSEFQTRPPEETFSLLFPIAAEYGMDGADGVAAQLLAELEPLCPVSCEEALLTLARGDWYVSDERVPFYLLYQFGRRELFASVEKVLAEGGLSPREANKVSTVEYWARLPTLRLAERISEYPLCRGVFDAG
jgi:hypothetical protein